MVSGPGQLLSQYKYIEARVRLLVQELFDVAYVAIHRGGGLAPFAVALVDEDVQLLVAVKRVRYGVLLPGGYGIVGIFGGEGVTI